MADFDHNGTFKITSALDGAVLDVSGAKAKKAAKVITYEWNGGKNQQWIASSESHGYRLQSALNDGGDALYVMDEQGNSTIGLYGFHGGRNQQWRTAVASGQPGAVFIENVQSGKVLRNVGHGNQVKCVAKSEEDRSSWWIVTEA